ncbi:MAG: hypothetical protein GX986_03445 [Firmicutes bacterium]|nr:hypothetical protein [Bacillota bacterium]
MAIRQTRRGEAGQALLEYALVMACIALPLILVADGMQRAMARFLRHLLMTVAIWPIGT